jgi:hypothetical protein
LFQQNNENAQCLYEHHPEFTKINFTELKEREVPDPELGFSNYVT